MARDNTPKLITSGTRGGGNKWLIQGLVALVIIALIGVIGYSIAMKKKDKDDKNAEQAAVAAGPSVYHDGYLQLGNPNAKVKMQITEDFACPVCKAFETESGPTIAKMVDSGEVSVSYRPIELIDRNSGGNTNYSNRSASAAACVAEADKSKWLAFHTSLFDQQGEEGGPGLTDEQIAATAVKAGVTSPAVADCIKSEKYSAFIDKTTDAALKEIKGTPSIKVNGTQLDDFSPAAITAAVNKAK